MITTPLPARDPQNDNDVSSFNTTIFEMSFGFSASKPSSFLTR